MSKGLRYSLRIKRSAEKEMDRLSTIDDDTRSVEIIAVGHRRDIYR